MPIKIDYPSRLLPHLVSMADYFPDRVKWDAETREMEITEPLTLERQVAMSYLHLVGEIEDVMSNIELVLADLIGLSKYPPLEPKEGERRYFLLTKVFFYELLRIRDSMPRFLKKMEAHGVLSKEDRHATKKLMENQFNELYMIRNVYLHGHSIPKSDVEHDLALISTLNRFGYAPELVPLSGGEAKRYPDLLKELAVKRHDGLSNVVASMATFCQSFVDDTAAWVDAHDFGRGPRAST